MNFLQFVDWKAVNSLFTLIAWVAVICMAIVVLGLVAGPGPDAQPHHALAR